MSEGNNTHPSGTPLQIVVRGCHGARADLETSLSRLDALVGAVDSIDFAAGNRLGSDTSTLCTIIHDELAQLRHTLGLRD